MLSDGESRYSKVTHVKLLIGMLNFVGRRERNELSRLCSPSSRCQGFEPDNTIFYYQQQNIPKQSQTLLTTNQSITIAMPLPNYR